jgi:hypothetical protein
MAEYRAGAMLELRMRTIGRKKMQEGRVMIDCDFMARLFFAAQLPQTLFCVAINLIYWT